MSYEAPKVLELGTLEEFTQGRRRGNRSDGSRNRRGGGGGGTS